MKPWNQQSYTDKIKGRIRILWLLIIAMLIYMVVMGEIGGDARKMSNFASIASRIIFFGGLIYVICRMIYWKKLLKNSLLLKEQMLLEQDERNQYLHDKSGGIVFDILFFLLLFITVTTALLNMPAFYVSVTILIAAIILKMTVYLIYSRFH